MTSAAGSGQDEQLVIFRLAGETYGIPILQVREIIRLCDITRIPRQPAWISGVVNLRGKIVPVIDLRLRLSLPPSHQSEATRIVIVQTDVGAVGVIVDSVSQVIRLPAAQIEPPMGLAPNQDAALVSGVGKLGEELVILLDIDKTLRIEATSHSAAQAA